MHGHLVVVVHGHLPGVHGPSVHDGLLTSVPSVHHDGLPSSVYDGRGGALRLLAQRLHHLVNRLLLAGLLLSSQANQLELVLHLLPPSLRADGFASLETGLQSLDDGSHAIDTPPHCAGGASATIPIAIAVVVQHI